VSVSAGAEFHPTSNTINSVNCHAQTPQWCDHAIVDDFHDVAQAAQLHAELWRHVEELSQRLERAEHRARRPRELRHCHALRAELYETHHLIDALNRRFPSLHQTATSA
jgi:hypothetical protein